MSDPGVVCLTNGPFFENCYLVADVEAARAVIIDPGEEADRFIGEARRRGWTLDAVWLTHGHLDHIAGVRRVKELTGVPVLLHPSDRGLYDALPRQASWFGLDMEPAPAPDQAIEAGQKLYVGRHGFTIRHVPGHSPGSVAFVGEGLVFSGDALFEGSIGRTDLVGGDLPTLLDSIHRELLSLDDRTVVYSGHGPATTIGRERQLNPFLRETSVLG